MIRKTREEAFWSRVEKTDRCWIWKGNCDANGYGRFCYGRRIELAHRVAWDLVNGPISDGLCVLHRCDNPPCVRAERDGSGELFLGTRGDNARDMAAKGRQYLQRHPERAPRGADHWMRRHPELVPRKSPRPCVNCEAMVPPQRVRRGRCIACSTYFRKHGIERPASLFRAA